MFSWFRRLLPREERFFDMHARHVELAFAPDGQKRLRVTAPPDAHVAPPGYYMLFLLSERGVPSEAAFVRLREA